MERLSPEYFGDTQKEIFRSLIRACIYFGQHKELLEANSVTAASVHIDWADLPNPGDKRLVVRADKAAYIQAFLKERYDHDYLGDKRFEGEFSHLIANLICHAKGFFEDKLSRQPGVHLTFTWQEAPEFTDEGGWESRIDKILKDVESERPSTRQRKSRDSSNSSSEDTLNLETPNDPVPSNSPFYIERDRVESECCDVVKQGIRLLRVESPTQMGKTSLIRRIETHAKRRKCNVVTISFRRCGESNYTNMEALLAWIESQLQSRLPEWVASSENEQTIPSDIKFERHLEEYLKHSENPLVLCLDDVDRVLPYPIANDFLSLLRGLYENKTPSWNRLYLVMTYSIRVEVSDIRRSPFNVGERVILRPFNGAEAKTLVEQHKLEWSSELSQFLSSFLGGHPYLVRIALYDIAYNKTDLETLRKKALTSSGIFETHFEYLMSELKRHQELKDGMKSLVSESRSAAISEETRTMLKSYGLAKLDGEDLLPLNELYQQYFKKRLE